MKKLLTVVGISGLLLLMPARGEGPSIRPPAVVGGFYPADPHKLRAAVKALLADALPPRGEKPVAIVAPHAGYLYSGQIAADAYRQASAFSYDVVVVLGTNHTVDPFPSVSVYGGAGYRTPLGVVKVDEALSQALRQADKAITFKPEAHAAEHSVEVQLPFIQVLFPGVKIVAAVVGRSDPALALHFGAVLARVLRGRNALIVASSDLSHYPNYDDAEAVDRSTLEAVATLDPSALTAAAARRMGERRSGLVTCACGMGPILAAMTVAKDLGAGRGIVVSYANSGDTIAGNPDRVVGYGAVSFVGGKGRPDTRVLHSPPSPGEASLTPGDRLALLALARKTLQRFYQTGTLPLPRPSSPGLRVKRGAFVTLTRHGDLRGCVGRLTADAPLALTVARMAIGAALNDRRFSPLRPRELKSTVIEVSVLTPLTKVSGPGSIRIGRDGILLERKGLRAVFLPQVAPEMGWGLQETLDHLCRKAGMEEGCWRRGAAFHTFQAEVFREEAPPKGSP